MMPCRGSKDVETVASEPIKQEEESPGKKADQYDNDVDEFNESGEHNDSPNRLKLVENNGDIDSKFGVRDNKQAKKYSAKKANRKSIAEGKKNKNGSMNLLKQDSEAGERPEDSPKQQEAKSKNLPKSTINVKKSRLCCSSSSVEVQDSVRPIIEPGVEKDAVTNDANDGDVTLDSDMRSDLDDYNDSENSEDKENEIIYQKMSTKGGRKKLKVNKGYVDDEPRGKAYKALPSSKKGKYSVHQAEEDALYASIEQKSPVKAGKKKKSSPQKSVSPIASVYDDEEEDNRILKGEGKGSNKKKKIKKPKMDESDEAMEMRSVYENQIASLQNNPTYQSELYSGTDFSATGQPTIQIERDLLDNADEERKKNKQRLRERKMKEREKESPVKANPDPTSLAYENAQREIDKVLGPREKKEDERRKEKRRSRSKFQVKDEQKDKADENVRREQPPETLEEARQKMHRLLDDAFSLFSQSRSSMGNKIHPSPRESSDEKGSSVSDRSEASHSSKEDIKETHPSGPEEKKHTPLFVERTHGPYDKSGLISWSPYRASDETALISLPSSQTDINKVPPPKEIITTSTFSESLPSSLRPNYYTTLPGEPIVIKMQDLDTKSAPEAEEKQSNGHIKQREQKDLYSEPYYGMSSYQEIPKKSTVPNLDSNGRANHEDDTAPIYSSPRERDGNHLDVRAHTAPARGGNKNNDVLDVIKQSVQPGASPEPLISSLRDELMSLSMKRKVSTTSNSKENDRQIV